MRIYLFLIILLVLQISVIFFLYKKTNFEKMKIINQVIYKYKDLGYKKYLYAYLCFLYKGKAKVNEKSVECYSNNTSFFDYLKELSKYDVEILDLDISKEALKEKGSYFYIKVK